jgi:branched-chain amino acid transport system permease protein
VDYFVQLIISGLVIGSIYALVALGFTVIYKATRVVNFAQGELLMFGAYICYAFVVQYRVPFIPALLLTMVFSAVLALSIERLILRPMIGEPIISIIMVTIGLALVLSSIVKAIWQTQIRIYSPKLFPQTTTDIAGIPVSQEFIWCFVLSIILLIIFSIFFKYSRAGIAMRATAFSNQVAQSMGISVKMIFALSWAIASIVSAPSSGQQWEG